MLNRIKTPFIESAADEGWSGEAYVSVGETLQERREELHLTLDDVADGLRIKSAYLAALERGRLEELPGQTYAIGFVRAYADYLGLDSEEMLSRFKAETAAFDTRPDLAFPVPLAERSLPGGAMLLVALILALCGYGTWYYLSTGERAHPERVTEVPAPLRASKPEPADAPAAASAGTSTAPGAAAASDQLTGAAPGPVARVAIAPASTGGASAATPLLVSPAAAAPTPPAAAPAAAPDPGRTAVATAPPHAAVGPATAGAARIVIRATADCWIQVRDAEQSLVFSRVLKAGETYQVPQRLGLSMRTGNAGVLQIAVDGRNAPPIGSVGMLRRNVSLDPASLLAGTAVKG
ncbi:MAG TPA: RodZ domain-containing protein [Stellaceae bacterium]|nr:RodZ domain-containing protein [Stellaceae bacterium]